ncbi:MAG: hypothetical protein JW757_14255 [Anaerolineales bacterium]|nr:hypothetical protein [Anaerolineales bacterium]
MSIRDRIIEETTQRFCSHANCKVELKTTYIYPSDIMPDLAPRIQHRGCSHYFTCTLHDKSACTFAVEKINNPNLRVEVPE